MTMRVKGKTREEAAGLLSTFHDLVTKDERTAAE
jgi:hypothetical protein